MAINHLFSAFYYPTALVAVDDNVSFLRLTSALLTSPSIVYPFEEPLKAITFLNQYERPTLPIKISLQAQDPELYATEDYQFNINFMNFSKIIDYENRFEEISVLIVDYHMLGMTGIELCRNLKKHQFKIILITADQDRGLAVDELNKGTIDFYLMKSEPEFNIKLNGVVEEMQKAYFNDLSKSLIDSLIDNTNSVLSQLSFPEFLDNFLKEHDIAEYYLIDPTGSLFMLDQAGHCHWLIIKKEEDLNAYLDLAADSKAPASVLNAIESRQSIPFFATQKEISLVDGKQWENYIYPARRVPGTESFYYAHVKDKMLYPFDKKDILSFNDFLKKQV